MFPLASPSGIVQPEYGKESGILAKNEQYEKILKLKVGSDNYTDRPAQTFNYQPKQKDQQSQRIEKNDAGAFAAVWDLYDARMQDQLNEYEQLQEDMYEAKAFPRSHCHVIPSIAARRT